MIYTFYTDSHVKLLNDWFMKTISDTDKDKVIVKKFEQACSSGEFMSEGWNVTMLKKVEYIQECIALDKPFFHLDSDIQFFDSWYDEYMEILITEDIDILAQSDGSTICCGFMGINPSNKMKLVFEEVYELTKTGKSGNDQLALNSIINKHNVKVKYLGEECFSIWRNTAGRVWEPGMFVSPPDNMKMHHANFVVGMDKKIELMKQVRNNAKKGKD